MYKVKTQLKDPVTKTFVIEKTLSDKVEQYAADNGMTFSIVIRQMLMKRFKYAPKPKEDT